MVSPVITARPLPGPLAPLLLAVALTAGCGADGRARGPATVATASTVTETITEADVRALVARLDADPAMLCDVDHATEQLIVNRGGPGVCREAALGEDPGAPSQVTGIDIVGPRATAVLTDQDGPSRADFVLEGGRLKVASLKRREAGP